MDKTTYQCPACKKVHFARPEMSGERFRCTCGQILVSPEVDGGEARPYDLVPEWEPEGGKKPKRVTRAVVPVAPPPEPVDEEGLEYEQPRKKKSSEADKWGPRRAREEGPRFDREAEFARAASRSAALQWGLVVAVFLGLSLALMWSVMKRMQPPPRPLVGDDVEVQDQTRAWGATEVVAWLAAGPANRVTGLSDAEAKAVAKKFYEMGAVKVVAFGSGSADDLAIELPDDAAKRAALFEWNKRYMEANRKEGQLDQGQRWLIVRMKP